ncbi:MAG: response regulator [Betaproteobacteria bacterium]
MKNKKVLIVEDQADIRILLRMTLDTGSFEIFEAESGAEGFRMAETIKPDIVLMDVMMPGELDGFQACRKIKDHPRLYRTSVILITARGQQEDHALGAIAGADAYLVKPFSPLELLDTIQDLLGNTVMQ